MVGNALAWRRIDFPIGTPVKRCELKFFTGRHRSRMVRLHEKPVNLVFARQSVKCSSDRERRRETFASAFVATGQGATTALIALPVLPIPCEFSPVGKEEFV